MHFVMKKVRFYFLFLYLDEPVTRGIYSHVGLCVMHNPSLCCKCTQIQNAGRIIDASGNGKYNDFLSFLERIAHFVNETD